MIMYQSINYSINQILQFIIINKRSELTKPPSIKQLYVLSAFSQLKSKNLESDSITRNK